MKISEMMNAYRDDTVILEEEQEVSVQRIKELTMSRISRKKRRPLRTVSILAAVLAVVLSLSAVSLAASRGVTVSQLLRGYFGGQLTPSQETVIEELGTTDFSGDVSEAQPEPEESPTFASVTQDGVTITPLAAMSDGYRFILKLKIAMEDGTPLPEEDFEWYDLAVALHISEQVWCPYPTREVFSKEGCAENEVICTQDYEFGGTCVKLPEIINVKGLEKTAPHALSEGMIFEGDWPLNIGGMRMEKAIQPPLCRDSFLKTVSDFVESTDKMTLCQADILSAPLSPLTLTMRYTLTEMEDGVPGDAPSVLDGVTVVMKDGSRVSACYSGERLTLDGICETYYMLEQPVSLDEVERVEW